MLKDWKSRLSSLPKKQPTLNAIMGIPIIGLPTLLLNTLQFDSVNETFIWVASVASSLGDIAFLSKKEFDGDLKTNKGSLSATGTLATLTASALKDLYIAKAKVTFFLNGNVNTRVFGDIVELRLDGVSIEDAVFSQVQDPISLASGGLASQTYEFTNIGKKVNPAQNIELEVTNINAQTDVKGFIECYEVDEGTSPVLWFK